MSFFQPFWVFKKTGVFLTSSFPSGFCLDTISLASLALSGSFQRSTRLFLISAFFCKASFLSWLAISSVVAVSWNTCSHYSLACFSRSNNLCFASSAPSEANMIPDPLKSSLWGRNGGRITAGGFWRVSKACFPHLQFSVWVLSGHDLLGELGSVRVIPEVGEALNIG